MGQATGWTYLQQRTPPAKDHDDIGPEARPIQLLQPKADGEGPRMLMVSVGPRCARRGAGGVGPADVGAGSHRGLS
jgi:hypothetical protein